MIFQETTATKRILKLTKRIRAVAGGTSASKTISVLIYLIARAQSDKKPTLTSVVAESVPHLKRGAIRDFQNIMKAHNYWKESRWNKTDSTYTFETGSKIEFFSSDNGDKLRGARRDRLFINEANNNSFEAFNQLEVRTNEFVFLDWNPTNEFWFYTDIKDKRDDVDFITLTYKDNEALDPRVVDTIEKRKGNVNWWRVYGLGQLGEVANRIYTGWQIIDEIPHEARLERFGIDFGFTNDPTVIEAIYYYNGGYIIDELLYQKGVSTKTIADVIMSVGNVLAIGDGADPRTINELKLLGVNIIGSAHSPGSVREGIQYVQEQKISITSRSTRTLKGYRNYLFKTDKEGRILNTPDDTIHEWSNPMDAIRYGFEGLKPKKPININTFFTNTNKRYV